ncbi:putative F-box protein At1g67623 [Arachis duranensis]|uniref:F-box protein At1g67623 n=1 Tax=Arachis duranensis TaxID=130453 RepID=A0A6P4DK41_ARADU|nr:putative F-box protein At1g67623 [Arachis duranensis]
MKRKNARSSVTNSSILFIISNNPSTKFLQMAGSSEKDTKKVDVSVQHECPLNLLPREIWSIIATMVTSNSIEDLFNMQATCKVFLGAARSDAVYKHATMSYKSLARFLLNLDGPERRFLDHCVEVENVDAIVRHGFAEYLRFGCLDKGMELLARASTEGSVEAGYLYSMLLMFDHEDEEDMVRGVQMMEGFRISGQLESYTNFLMDVCKDTTVILNELFARI